MSAPDPETTALAKVTRLQDALDLLEAQATKAASVRSAAMLKAQEAGATYDDLVAATGLSKVRVGQLLTQQRNLS